MLCLPGNEYEGFQGQKKNRQNEDIFMEKYLEGENLVHSWECEQIFQNARTLSRMLTNFPACQYIVQNAYKFSRMPEHCPECL